MNVTFEPVISEEDIEKLAALADEIWHEYWTDRIGAAQTDYMIEQYQSPEAIKRDMAHNAYEYWFITARDDDSPDARPRVVGYTGGHVEPETNRYFISKVYVLAHERGNHFASAAMRFYEELCRERGLHAMYLAVNKENELAIRAYVGTGFNAIDSTVTDIGGGFIMDDYVMEKEVSPLGT